MIKTEAIVLKAADLGEADRLLTVYSKNLGRVNISAKGVKKLESKLRYSIEPISYAELILIEGKNFLILKDAILLNQFLNIKKDLAKIKIADKVINLIEEAIVGEEQDENIWELILATLGGLDAGDATPRLSTEFQDNLLKLLGYDPKFIKNLRDIY